MTAKDLGIKEEPEEKKDDGVGKGALSAGSDLDKRNCTLVEAEAHCNASASCKGFTFRGDGLQPSGTLLVYFKARANVNSDDEWVSWVKGAPLPPKWSQQFQADLVEKDVRAALSIPHVSGISLWQTANTGHTGGEPPGLEAVRISMGLPFVS